MKLESSVYVSNNTEEYKDVDVCVSSDSGEQWIFTVSLDKKSNVELDDATPRYAENNVADFEECESVPEEVRAEFLRVRGEAIALLRQK